jgi:hypothetical protein
MSNHLHWYIDATIGAKDGTEIDIADAINLGAVNTAFKISTTSSSYKYCPPIIKPLYFRMEDGWQITEGTFKCGNALNSNAPLYIGAVTSSTNFIPQIFTTELAAKQALDANNIRISTSSSGTALTITEANKITDVNQCILLMILFGGEPSQIGELYPQDIINFSFSETVTA